MTKTRGKYGGDARRTHVRAGCAKYDRQGRHYDLKAASATRGATGLRLACNDYVLSTPNLSALPWTTVQWWWDEPLWLQLFSRSHANRSQVEAK